MSVTGANSRDSSDGTHERMVHTIADAIRRYLDEHHDAADSAEGIQGFWLPAGLRSESLAWVTEALDVLERTGVVAKREIDGAAPVYCRARR